MRNMLFLLAATAATPVMAHDIAADHSHVGESVLFHISPLVALGAGVAALAVFILLRKGNVGKVEEDRRDPR